MDPRHCSIPPNVVAAVNISGVLERGPPGARLPFADCSRYTNFILVKNGHLLIVQRWLPRVQESDLYVCQWSDDRVYCIWNDKQVDVFISFSVANRWRVQQMITITHLLEKLKINITYEPLAIVVRGADILGFVMARVEGRLLEMRDRSLAHNTLAKLHEANIMFESGLWDKERDRLEARAWQMLDVIFDELPRLDKSSVLNINQHCGPISLLRDTKTPRGKRRIHIPRNFFSSQTPVAL
ncbi:hypothetical protein C8R41DRAFT_377132 [Lentinula lateritia]|uniref:Uncharacterized protein n=1 Tax=Lentinula lateritia TaxID=40482 RepID=A0ABQ8VE75_9AGAR|nr:hypothetical protein C8R41DRAFT_377132 [Lentinula lateritia]